MQTQPPPAPPGPPQYETRTPEQHFEALVAELNIPRQLALAIKEQESGRRPFQTPGGGVLTSEKNARGWFQVLPATAAGYKLDANDPFQNIEAGLRYIKEGLDQNNNDPDIAARYYHGGPDRTQWGPLTEQYGAAVGQRLRALLAADGGQATPAPVEAAAPARSRRGEYPVPTADELKRETAPAADPNAKPPAPPWYRPDQLYQTAQDLGAGALKGAGQTATNLGRLPHLIPGVSSAIDWLYGTPGLSAEAFPAADAALAPTNTTQSVGKGVEQVAEVLVPGATAARVGAKVSTAVAPRLAPYVGKTAAKLLPRAAVEAPAAAGIAAAQGGDPTTAAGLATAIPVAGAALRIPFSGTLSPVAQRAVDFARARGIPVDLATATANQWARNIQTAAEQTPFGGAVRAVTERVRGGRLARTGQELADQVHPVPVSPIQAGHSVGEALDARVGRLGQTASVGYDTAEQAVAALPLQSVPSGAINTNTGAAILTTMRAPVAMQPIRQALAPLLKELEGATIAVQEVSPALPALRRIMGGGPFHDLLSLEKDLGALKRLADASGGLRDRSQGLAARGVQVLQDAIDDAARQADPRILAGLVKGRKDTALKHLVDDLRTKYQGTAADVQARGAEPMRGFKLLTQPDDVNIEYLKKLKQQVGPTEMRKVGRGVIQELLDTATEEGGYKRAAAMANKWKALGDETKKVLYTPRHVADLDNFFRIGRMLAEHPNPSRSALVGISAGSVPFAIRYPIATSAVYGVTGAVAFLMNDPRGVRLLTQGLTLPGGTPAAAQWARQVEEVLKEHPKGSPTKGRDVHLPREPPRPPTALPGR